MRKCRRRYWCKHCKRYIVRVSGKLWHSSYCERTGKDARLRWCPVRGK